MRSRVKNYYVSVDSNSITIHLPLPSGITLQKSNGSLTSAARRYVMESARLIFDETTGAVLLSSGAKIGTVSTSSQTGYDFKIAISKATLISMAEGDTEDIAAINGVTANDQFTIAFDWGSEPEDLANSLLSRLKSYLGFAGGEDEDGNSFESLNDEEIKAMCSSLWESAWGEVLHTADEDILLDADGNPIGFPYFENGVMYVDATFNNGVLVTANGEFSNGVLTL